MNRLSDNFVQVIIVICVIAFLFLSDILVENLSSNRELVFAVFIIVVIIISNVTLASFLVRKQSIDEATNIKNDFASVVDRLASLELFIISRDEYKSEKWLFKQAQLNILERSVVSQVWVVSPDLKNDTGNSPLIKSIQESVKYNVTRGIKYTYVIPKDMIVRGRTNELKKLFKNNEDRLDIREVERDIFLLLSETHLAIYNPMEEHDEPLTGFMELPLENKGWWVQMSNDHAILTRERIKDVIENKSKSIII